jgi:hypothetical protein
VEELSWYLGLLLELPPELLLLPPLPLPEPEWEELFSRDFCSILETWAEREETP